MHFTLVTAVAVLAHTTQSFAAPIPASYEIQDLAARSDAKDNWKKALKHAADSVPDAALKVPVKTSMASVVQKAVAAAKQGSPSSSDGHHHTPRFPAAGAAADHAHSAPATKEKISKFQPNPPAPPKKSIAELAKEGFHKKSSKRDIIPDLEARSDPKDNWKKVLNHVAGSVPDAALKVPVKTSMASVVQKAVAAAKQGSSSSSDTHHHTPRLPAAAPAADHAHSPPATKEKISKFQPNPPAPPKKSIAELAKEGFHKKSSKRDIIPDLEARSDPKDNWKTALKHVAGSVPDAALKVPVKTSMASVVQKAVAAAKQGSSSSSDNHHAQRFPATAPITGHGQTSASLAKEKMSKFQPTSPPLPKKSIAEQAKAGFHKSSKRNMVSDLEARYLEIDELD